MFCRRVNVLANLFNRMRCIGGFPLYLDFRSERPRFIDWNFRLFFFLFFASSTIQSQEIENNVKVQWHVVGIKMQSKILRGGSTMCLSLKDATHWLIAHTNRTQFIPKVRETEKKRSEPALYPTMISCIFVRYIVAIRLKFRVKVKDCSRNLIKPKSVRYSAHMCVCRVGELNNNQSQTTSNQISSPFSASFFCFSSDVRVLFHLFQHPYICISPNDSEWYQSESRRIAIRAITMWKCSQSLNWWPSL